MTDPKTNRTGPLTGARTPLFSIGSVSRMLGVSVTALRAWEERYQLIHPERSPGGQRVFSREQVEQLRALKQLVDSGLTPADAHRVVVAQLEGNAEP